MSEHDDMSLARFVVGRQHQPPVFGVDSEKLKQICGDSLTLKSIGSFDTRKTQADVAERSNLIEGLILIAMVEKVR
jgi:hypothetical protein